MNNEIHNINEAYTQVNEIAFAHQEPGPEPEHTGPDPLQLVLQHLQKANGPLHGIPDNIIKELIAEYSSNAENNPELAYLNHNILDYDLFLLELSRSGKNFYILLNLTYEFVYPNVYTDFNQAKSFVMSILESSDDNDYYDNN